MPKSLTFAIVALANAIKGQNLNRFGVEMFFAHRNSQIVHSYRRTLPLPVTTMLNSLRCCRRQQRTFDMKN